MSNWQRIKSGKLGKEIFIKRALIIKSIRDWFWAADFLEVETPETVALPGQEPYLQVLDTEIADDRGQKFSASLITSPEYAMKKLLAAGCEKIFQITKAFRGNESFGGLHNPEFTILEWYRQNASYIDIMKDTEELVAHVLAKLNFSDKINYQGMEIDFSLPWERMSVAEAMAKFAGVGDLAYESLILSAREKGYKESPTPPRLPSGRGGSGESYDSVFFKIFLNEVENKFDKTRPIIIYDWPAELGALAKTKNDNPRVAERFEAYAGGLEIANAFSELLDPAEQKQRFLAEQKIRRQDGKKVYPIDEDLLAALGEIKNPCGGIALGVDRLVMLLTNQKEINNVIFFPAKELFY